ncbi:hypothetical protein Glove_714g23 [Diversispora epigaea]|uniref:Crinkler effector protein N-terminal domain-containing protein n=1 Tax=Diversispora epigaea TaxID=1348612 RepID=A0A397G0W2_9GLOM|nr:hypothetical protein Glove_714g23 [Diversispora epigaea]
MSQVTNANLSAIYIIYRSNIKNTFPVDIKKKRLIGNLKDAIKIKKAPEFNSFSANKLRLWKVEIPDDDIDQLNNFNLQDQSNPKYKRLLG